MTHPRTGIKRWTSPIVLSVLLFVAGGGGMTSIRSALADRHTASAARELQVSAMRVAAADALRIAGGDPAEPGLDAAVQFLGHDHAAVLDALSPADAARARALLVEIAGCGSWLLDPGDELHEIHGHAELQVLLDSAASSASASALAGERRAAVALAIALVVSVIGVGVVVRSIMRSKREQSSVLLEQRAGQRLAALVQDSPDIFVIIDPGGAISYRSMSASRLLPDLANHLDDLVLLAGEDEAARLRIHLQRKAAGDAHREFELTRPDGARGWFELRVSDLTADPAVGGHLVTARDVTFQHRFEDKLREQASTDALTGLRNRWQVKSCLEAAVAATASDATVAFVVLDVDGFKGVNDLFGHEAGDALLRLVATRLRAAVGPVGEVLRLGSDEFAAVLPDVSSTADALERAERLAAVFAEPFAVAGGTEPLTAGVGLAVADHRADVAGLHAKAEIALLAAKRRNDQSVVEYEIALEESLARTTSIRRALYSANYDDEFEVVYQPIVATETLEITGLEALLRWEAPNVGAIGPSEFIPIAEATGDICAIGRWVLENVCRQLSTWSSLGLPPQLTVSINVSARQLAEGDFVSFVSSTAQAWGIDPGRLVIEVTETEALDQSGIAIGRLGELRNAGFRISIDDFGSGYSNLGQLLRVPFDVLKIDRSLLVMLTTMHRAAGRNATDPCQIISAIVTIAEILGVPVVCEGVETSEQLRSLAASGISHVQGYLTGRPAKAENITRRLELAQGVATPSSIAGAAR